MPDDQSPPESRSETSRRETAGRRADDSGTRGFLQVAEEHRRRGRLNEAITTLEEGLAEHPGHVAAQVALGRCWLEAGDAESAHLQLTKVVDQDITHMVAAKLLVEAHIRLEDPDAAERQLDLYSVLNSSDPDIEPLRRRIEAMQPEDLDRSRAGDARDGAGKPLAESLPASPTAKPQVAALHAPPPRDRVATETSPLAAESAAQPPVFSFSPQHREIYLAALASEGLFPVAVAPEPAVESASPPEPEPAREPGHGASEAAPPVTVTLGELYLEQGHLDEAERIFRELLAAEPAHARARQGLVDLLERRGGQPQPVSQQGDRDDEPATSDEAAILEQLAVSDDAAAPTMPVDGDLAPASAPASAAPPSLAASPTERPPASAESPAGRHALEPSAPRERSSAELSTSNLAAEPSFTAVPLLAAGELASRLMAGGDVLEGGGSRQQRQLLLTRYLGLLRRRAEHDVP